MSFEEDTYNTIFKAMQNPIRRRILRTIEEKPATYTEVQTALNIDNGLLNYHLDALTSLITKSDEKYTLSDFGRATIGLIKSVEEPKPSSKQSSSLMKWVTAILVIALAASGLGLLGLNNSYFELSGKYQVQEMEKLQLASSLQAAQQDIEKLSATVATLERGQKTPLIEASLSLLLANLAKVNDTMWWMWILDTEEARSVDFPYSMSGTDIRLVSLQDVEVMTARTNGTRVYTIDGISLSDSTHGLVRFSRWYVYNSAGVLSVYGVNRSIYYLERRAGSWVINGREEGMGDAFRLIPWPPIEEHG